MTQIKTKLAYGVSGTLATANLADDAVTAAKIADNAVVTAAINADAITSAKIADNAVVTAAINADAITGAKLADNAINSEHYTDGSIDTAHVADSQITAAKTSGVGVAVVDQWRTTGHSEFSGSGRHYVTANWEENDTVGFEYQGGQMTQSSGIFTFPSTGKYLIRFCPGMTNNQGGTNRAMAYVMPEIHGTRNNSGFTVLARSYSSNDDAGGEYYMACTVEYFWDVTNTTNDKVKFGFYVANGMQTKGDNAIQQTAATFVKVGDT